MSAGAELSQVLFVSSVYLTVPDFLNITLKFHVLCSHPCYALGGRVSRTSHRYRCLQMLKVLYKMCHLHTPEYFTTSIDCF